MRVFFDAKFRKHRLAYLIQSFMAAAGLFVLLMVVDGYKNGAVVASFGASSFILFTMPHAESSRPRYLLGGYLIGIIVGFTFHHLAEWWAPRALWSSHEHVPTIAAALAVGVAILIMVITNTEHPPAAGLALGLAFGECAAYHILIIVAGIVMLVTIKHLLKRFLINLL